MVPSRRTELALYFGIALAGVMPTLATPGSTVGDGVDAFGTHWFYWWIRTCVEHFGDPSYTNLFFYPFGKEVFAHTGNNFVDAVMAVPFQWVFGHTLYSPMWTMVLVVGNAVAFRPLARYVLGDAFAAFAATALWTINPFVFFELTAGRPTQAMCWFLPVAVLYFLRCAREPGVGNAVWLGIAVAVAGWTYWFSGFFLVLLLLPLAVWELWGAGDRLRVLGRWALGVVVCAALVAPGVFAMAGEVGAGNVPGVAVEKGSIFQAPKPMGNNVSADLHGIWLMELYGAPLFFNPAWGLPLLVAPWLRRLQVPGGRGRWVVALVFVLAFAGGTLFRWEEHVVVMPQYMLLYNHVPFFDRLWFPYRMAAVAFIPASLLLGALCASLPRPRAALGALATVGLVAQVLAGTWPHNHRVARAPAMVADLKNHGGAVIFLPMKIQHDGLMWQTEFQLPTFGGMGESAPIFWPKEFRVRLNNSLVKSLRGAAITPGRPKRVSAKDRALIEKEGFRWVILRRSLLESDLTRQLELAPDSFDKWERINETVEVISEVLGAGPAAVGGDAVVWDLQGRYVPPQPEWAATPETLANLGWEESGMPFYEQKLRDYGRTGGVRTKTEPPPPGSASAGAEQLTTPPN